MGAVRTKEIFNTVLDFGIELKVAEKLGQKELMMYVTVPYNAMNETETGVHFIKGWKIAGYEILSIETIIFAVEQQNMVVSMKVKPLFT